VKTLPLLFSALWAAGCTQDDTPPVQDIPPADGQVEQEPEPEPEPTVDPMLEAMAMVQRGELTAAMPAVEALLGEHADDPALWYALELCALGSGHPGELLDRLSVTEAIGGQELAHHSLRATLALAAQRHADTVDAAFALRATDPGLSSVFMARALLAGATVATDTLDPEQPGDALVLLTTEANPSKQEALTELAAQVDGWRAALLRAQILTDRQDEDLLDAIGAELDTVAASDDPRAVLAEAQMRLGMMDDPALAAPVALAAADKLMAAHNTIAATELLAGGIDLLLMQGLADQAFELSTKHLEALPAEPSPVRATATTFAIDAAIAAGELRQGVELASAAMSADEPGPSDAELALGMTRAAWRLCDLSALDTAAKALPEPQAAIAQGMSSQCTGDLQQARERLASGQADGPLAVDAQLALAWAWFSEDASVDASQAALGAAIELGWATNIIEAGLALERHARVTRQIEPATQVLTALDIDASPALQAELYARRTTLGLEAPVFPTIADEPALVTAWRGFAEPTPAAAEQPSTGIAAWADARNALRAGAAGESKQAFDRAMPALPVRRQGRWTPPLALDGADGPGLDTDVDAALDLTNKGGEDALLALHEFSHFRDFQRMAASVGYDWTIGLDAQAKAAFTEAYGREQARTLLWLAGTAPFPTEARDATTAAIPEQTCFAGISAPLDVADVRTQYAETALFSIRLGTRSGEMLLVTPSSTKVKRFDKPDQLRGWVEGYLTALNTGRAFGGGSTNPRDGDRFRHEVIDGVIGDLVGIARYLVVADADVMRLPWAVLPEQIEGRRYLADIRTVSSLPYLGTGRIEPQAPEGGYKPDFLGLSREEMTKLEDMSQEELAVTDDVTRTMLEAGLKPQGETSSIARLFGGGYSLVKQGSETDKASFDDNLPAARYLHLAGIPASPSGGFLWVDGETRLPELACADTSVRLAVLSTGPSPEIQLVRAQALRDAGADGVLVAMWNPPPILRSRYLTSVYDALNRERAPARALAEARETLVNTLGADGGQADPSYWGAFLYVGAP